MKKKQTYRRLTVAETILVAIIIGMIAFVAIYVRNVKNNTSDLYRASSSENYF